MKQFLIMILLLFLLLLFHDAVAVGTQNGLLLWYNALIPSLLPFILVTNSLSETNAYHTLTVFFPKKYATILYELFAILLGNMCGYPLGAKIINDFVKYKYISSGQANRILALSSQSSPMFLLGYVYHNMLSHTIPIWLFLASIYIPVILYYLLTFKKVDTRMQNILLSTQSIQIKDTFLHTVEILVVIGMYVILFSILTTILLPLSQNSIYNLCLSFLEITTGLNIIQNLMFKNTFSTALLCCLCSFGGLCSMFQVICVVDYPEINIKKYLYDKCILCIGTFLIIILFLSGN